MSWKHNLKFNYIQEDIDDNPYFLYMKKWRQIKRKEKRNSYIEYQPISLEYFLNMKFAGGGGGKEIITQNETLRSVEDVYTFFSTDNNLQLIRETLNNNGADDSIDAQVKSVKETKTVILSNGQEVTKEDVITHIKSGGQSCQYFNSMTAEFRIDE